VKEASGRICYEWIIISAPRKPENREEPGNPARGIPEMKLAPAGFVPKMKIQARAP
jgi:hypothetical protein